MTLAERGRAIAERREVRYGLPLLPLALMLVMPPTLWRCAAVALAVLIPAYGGGGAYEFVSPRSIRWKTVLAALPVIVAATTVATIVTMYVLQQFGIPPQKQPAAEHLARLSGVDFYSMLVMIVFGSPICEELLFRHAIFGSFAVCMNWIVAAVFSAVFFAAIHFAWQYFPGLLAMALILQFVYLKSGSLATAMVLHAANNLLAVLLVITAG